MYNTIYDRANNLVYGLNYVSNMSIKKIYLFYFFIANKFYV